MNPLVRTDSRNAMDQFAAMMCPRDLILPGFTQRLFPFAVAVVLLSSLLLAESTAAEPVRARLGTDTAWTGQAVPLIITIASPGPFSGTAAFDLPELPQTAILKIGNPVVGSEDVDGESMLTQRHEFRIYTQQSGRFVLPPIAVRFQGKKSFVGEAEAMRGSTSRLTFLSKRPPGTEAMGMMVSTTKLESTQSWTPEENVDMRAGDVAERTITRRAGTTAMFLPPVPPQTIDGVRTYTPDPIVEDKITRGDLDASRVETIKYQFRQAGTYVLPDITFTWWDPDATQLRSTTLAGRTVNVAALPADSLATDDNFNPSDTSQSRWWAWALAALVSACIMYKPLHLLQRRWSAGRNTPEALAARHVNAACQAGDPKAAYAAILAWTRIVAEGNQAMSPSTFLGEDFIQLESRLFRANGQVAEWSGEPLRSAFATARQQQLRPNKLPGGSPLPDLNP